MAEASNANTPGTTGTEGQHPENTPSGGTKELMAGKFESKEALERGYLELETAYHENTQKISELTEAVAALANNRGQATTQDQYWDPNQNGSGGGAGGGGVDANAFWANPQGVLDQRDANITRKVVGVLADTLGSYFDTQDWKTGNPDLAKHERIVMSFLNETDKAKPMKDRLAVAAQKTRDYLKDLGIGNTTPGSPPANNQVIESPTGSRTVVGASNLPPGAPGGPGTEVITDQTRLNTLNDYLKDRLAQRVKLMG